VFAVKGNFVEAVPYFQQAVKLEPMILENQFKLIRALEYAGQIEQAIEATKNAVESFSRNDQQQAATTLNNYLERMELKRTEHQNQLK
jgi:tetratricopeptide (TPR) repeat protein